jgi:hypothetical protein
MSLLRRLRRAVTAREGGVDPHAWELPSSFKSGTSDSSNSTSTSKPQTVIPDPRVVADAFVPSNIEIGTEKNALLYPDPSHGAVHLALLECFRNLRLSIDVLDSVPLSSPPPAYKEDSNENQDHDSTHDDASIGHQRWDMFIRLAVTRFEGWWSNLDRVLRHAAGYTLRTSANVPVQLTKDYLPPLDVLLVWYALMLDTPSYRLLLDQRDIRVQNLSFPWSAVRDVINMDTMAFELPSPAQTLFIRLTDQSPNLGSYLQHPPAYSEAEVLPIGVDLFALVKKADAFIDQSHKLLWIRGPSLRGSLIRSTVGYFDVQMNPTDGDELVEGEIPFGVELMWKTHRLFPAQYEYFLKLNGGSRPNVADLKQNLAESVSGDSDSSDDAAQPCDCWTCERIRDELPDFVHIVPGDEAGTSSAPPSPPGSPPSLMRSQLDALSSSQIRKVQEDIGFHRAVESARQAKKPLPRRPTVPVDQEPKPGEPGYVREVHEYFEKLPDGRYKIRKQRSRAQRQSWTWS